MVSELPVHADFQSHALGNLGGQPPGSLARARVSLPPDADLLVTRRASSRRASRANSGRVLLCF